MEEEREFSAAVEKRFQALQALKGLWRRVRLESALRAHSRWLAGQGGRRADLSGWDLSGQKIILRNLTRAILVKTKMAGAFLLGSALDQADLRGAVLTSAYLVGVSLEEANLQGANLRFAHLASAYLVGADLTRVEASYADMRGADMRDVVARQAVLRGALLIGADCSRAIFEGADLGQADLALAFLDQARLSGASLTGTCFYGAALAGAQLHGARLNFSDPTLGAELLRRAAATGYQQMVAAWVGSLGVDYIQTLDEQGEIWALRVLAQYLQEGDNAPLLLRQAKVSVPVDEAGTGR